VGPEAASDSTGADDRLERGLAFLATRQPHAVPLFLFLHSYAVHDYFRLHPATVERLPQRPVETPEELTACLKAERRCPPETWAELRRLYELEVAEFDTAVARLVDTLRARHLWDSTVLVLVSDPGEGRDVLGRPRADPAGAGPARDVGSATGGGRSAGARGARQGGDLGKRGAPAAWRARGGARSGRAAQAAPVSVVARRDGRLRA